VLPFCRYFGRAGKVGQINGHFLLSDLDRLDDDLDDLPLFLGREGGPAGMEIARFGQDFIPSDILDFEEVELTLEPRQLLFEALEAAFEGPVLAAEPIDRDLIGHIGAIDLVHLLLDLRLLGFESL
jgi:hypothetical protein